MSQKSLGCTQNDGFVTSHTPWWTAVVVLLLLFYSMLCCVCVVYYQYSIIISSRLWLYILPSISKTYWIYRFRWCTSYLFVWVSLVPWSSWPPWSAKQAASHFAVNSERPNFARFCAFRLVNLAEGLLVCAAGEENFAVCVLRQARSHLFACGRAL